MKRKPMDAEQRLLRAIPWAVEVEFINAPWRDDPDRHPVWTARIYSAQIGKRCSKFGVLGLGMTRDEAIEEALRTWRKIRAAVLRGKK